MAAESQVSRVFVEARSLVAPVATGPDAAARGRDA